MSTAFKIAVLGPIPRDHITTYQNEVVEKYGCVIYPVVALSTLMSEGSRIVPVTHVRKVDQAPIQQILSSFRNVDPGHVAAEVDQGDVIRLKYVDQIVIKKNRPLQICGYPSPVLERFFKKIVRWHDQTP